MKNRKALLSLVAVVCMATLALLISPVAAAPSIQDMIDAAAPGDTVNVPAGAYNESITIGKALTLLGAGAVTISGTGATVITITADSVTVDGFTIKNPAGKHGVYAQDRSNIAITNNVVTDIGSSDATTSGTNFGIAVVSSASGVNGVTIANNQINQIVGGNFKSATAIAAGWSNGAYDITGLLVQDNAISDITSDWSVPYSEGGRGAYGILINHGTGTTGKTVAPQIRGNSISDLEGLWSHGIGLEGNTPNAVVECNTIKNLVDHKDPSDAVAVMVEDNASAATVVIQSNDFINLSVGVANVTGIAGVSAINNWWGASDGPGPVGTGSGAYVTPDVIFSPWLTSGSTCVAGYEPPQSIPATNNWAMAGTVVAVLGLAALMLRRRKAFQS